MGFIDININKKTIFACGEFKSSIGPENDSPWASFLSGPRLFRSHIVTGMMRNAVLRTLTP